MKQVSMNLVRMIVSLVMALGLMVIFLWGLGGFDVNLPKVRANPDILVCPSGSGSCNYSSIQDAVNNASSGEVIKVAEGIYTEHVKINSITLTLMGGYAGDPPTSWTNPDPDSHPTIVDGQSTDQVIGITSGASVTLQGLVFRRGYDSIGNEGSNIHVDGSQVLITDCVILSGTTQAAAAILGAAAVHLEDSYSSKIMNTVIHGNAGRQGVYVSSSDNVTLWALTVTQNTDEGIYLRNNDNTYVAHSFIAYNGQQGIYADKGNTDLIFADNIVVYNQEEGIFFEKSHTAPSILRNVITANVKSGITLKANIYNTTIKQNHVTNNGECGIYCGDPSQGDSNGSDILNNIIADNADGGICVANSQDQEIDNNIIVNNGGAGVALEGNASDLASATLRHNTLVSNAIAGVEVGAESHAILKNNIVASHTVGVKTVHRTAQAEVDHTLWFGYQRKTASAGGGQIEVTDDVEGDPRFAGGDDLFQAYHIRTGSAAIDAGVTTGLTTDIDEQNRAAPDVGVDEFEYALQLTPNYRETVGTPPPSSSYSYTHFLTNTGSVTQTFSLAVSTKSPETWAPQIWPSSIELGSGESASVWLTVTVPSDTPRGEVDRRWITASVQGHAEVSKVAYDVTLVGVGAALSPGRSAYAVPDPSPVNRTIIYTHTLTNIGDASDSFTVEVGSEYHWFSLDSAETINDLASGVSDTITVSVLVPYTAAAGLIETTWITVTSHLQSEAFDVAQDTTIVSPTQGTRYVATTTTVPDHLNNCLLDSQPCRTLAQAVDQAWRGDTIKMANGVYTDADIAQTGMLAWVRKAVTVAGSYAAGWSIATPEDASTILDAENQGVVLFANDATTLTLEGLTLRNGKGERGGIVEAIATRLLMSHCVVSNAIVGDTLIRGGLVYLSDSDGSRIADSYFEGSSDTGIFATASESLLLIRNVISGNGAEGVYFDRGPGGSITATLMHNEVVHNDGNGIHFQSENYGITIVSNTIANNGPEAALTGRGIFFASSNKDVNLTNNTIIENAREGVYFVRSYDNVTLVNNTVRGNGREGALTAGSYGLYFGNNGQNAVLTDNIVMDNGAGGAFFGKLNHTHKLVGNFIVGNPGIGVALDQSQDNVLINNVIAENGVTGVQVGSRRAAGKSTATLLHNTIADNEETGVLVDKNAEVTLTNSIVVSHVAGVLVAHPEAMAHIEHTLWYANEGDSAGLGVITNTHNQRGAPHFIGGSVITEAYNIRYNSAAIDIGKTTSVTTDIEGRLRAPDAGAYEFPYALQFTPNYRKTVKVEQQQVPYAHTLRNSGSLTQAFSIRATTRVWTGTVWPLTLTAKVGNAAPVLLSAEDTITLATNASAMVTATLGVPALENIGRTWITATSVNSPKSFKYVKDVTFVGVGVELDAGQSENTTPGEIVTYTHIITNTGSRDTTYRLTMDSRYGWAELRTPSSLFLTGGATETIQIRVQVPITAGSLQETIGLTATYPIVPEVYDNVQDEAHVQAPKGTRYVATTGRVDPANSCLYTSYPCRAVAQAIKQAQGGDAVWVATGVYTDANTAAWGAVVPLNEAKAVTVWGGYNAQKWHAPPTTDPRRTILDAQNKGQTVDVRGLGKLTLSGLTLKHGREANVYVRSSQLILTNCNVLSASPGYGLYLYRSDNVRLERARIFDNADHGLYLFISENLTLTNSIIAENAGNGMVLEGIDASSYSSAILHYNTFAANAEGIGLELFTSKVTMKNTLIASQTLAISGTSSTSVGGSNNIVDANYTLWPFPAVDAGDVISGKSKDTRMKWDAYGYKNFYGDPKFAPPLDILRAYHLITGSVAIDQALDIGGIGTDIDGETRPVDNSDIGADEMQPSLELSKRASPPQPQVGERLTYTIYLTNTGGVTLTADIYDILPQEVDLIDPSSTWLEQEIAPYTVWITDVVVQIKLGYAGDLVNKVRVITDEGPLDKTEEFTVTAIADVAMTMTPLNQMRKADPGPVVYTHTLTNQSAVNDVFSLTHHTSQDWNVVYRPNPVALGYRGQPNDEATVWVTVTVPADAVSDTKDIMVLTTTSSVDPKVSVRVTDTTLVRLAPDVVAQPQQKTQATDPGTEITYTFTLTNTGNGQDAFDLTVGSALGWPIQVTPSQTQKLDYGEMITVSVILTVPLGSGGLLDTLTLTATSHSDPNMVASFTATTTVNHDPAVSLQPNRAATAWSGQTAVYTHTLTNLGNGPDVFDIAHHSSQGWPVTYTTPIAVGYNQTATAWVTVTVPASQEGVEHTTTVTATSQADATVFAVVTDTTTGAQADFTLSPSPMYASLTVDNRRPKPLTVTNKSNTTLNWRLVTPRPGWLSVTPTLGTVPIASQGTIDVEFDATGLTNERYTETLRIRSDDDRNVSQTLPITLTVCYPVSAQDLTYAQIGKTVYFTGTAQGSTPITYMWDFGDGRAPDIQKGQGTTATTQHIYDTVARYTVMLTVSNLCNEQRYSDVISESIEVVASDLPDIEVSPTLPVTLATGQTAQTPLVIQNTGTGELTITSIQEKPSVAWLTLPAAWPLTVTAGLSKTVTLQVDASGLSSHTEQTTTLAIRSNDPDEETKNVAVTLYVTDARIYLPLVLKQ